MERASLQCSGWILAHYGRHHAIKIICGQGNNGGDGLAMARQLSAMDYQVDVFLISSTGNLSDNARANLNALSAQATCNLFNIVHISDLHTFTDTDVVVDALLGSGLNRPLSGLLLEVVDALNLSSGIKVSIDIPSGLPGEGVMLAGAAFKAHYTLTFQFPYLSFLFPENEAYVGSYEILNIGLHKDIVQKMPTSFRITEPADIIIMKRPTFGHKGTFGHALIIAGSETMAGAAILSAKACLRTGCGLVSVHVPAALAAAVNTALPEALLSIDASAVECTSPPHPDTYNACAMGPGIGTSDIVQSSLYQLITHIHRPLILDADALNILALNPQWLGLLPENTILTPHPGEFDRLFGRSNNSYERLLKQQLKAIETHTVIVLKGRYTSICTPDGYCWFNSTGNHGMATAGSGDVLTGIIASLLAQGYPAAKAALNGVYLHGLAGDMAASERGHHAVIASDIIHYIGNSFLKFNAEYDNKHE